MYYFLDEENVVIGSGTAPHGVYKSVDAQTLHKYAQNPMGYKFKNSKLEKSKDLLEREAEEERRKLRDVRDKKLLNLVVTIKSGKEFDADEISQARMLMALRAAEISKEKTIKWKLANNSIVEISKTELREAIALAVAKTSELFIGEEHGGE